MSNIIYLPIKTPGGFYIYDRSVNTIFSVSENEYQELVEVRRANTFSNSPVVKRYRERGLLQDNNVFIIRHPSTDALSHYCENRLSNMVLQVTQQCNLRCSYCAYSGEYYNRVHNSARMSFETAKKAIDFYIARSRESNRLHLGFYGGEPLLEFNLMKKCVEYIKGNVEGKKLTFGITTNATLLTDEKIHFLHDNDFYLTISIDGSKEEHDACRVFPDGSGSFDIVMHNLKRVKELYPEYARKIMISTVVSPKYELNHVLEYFNSDDVLSDTNIIMTPVADAGLKKKVNYKESYYQVRRCEYLKLLLYMIGKIDKKYISRMVENSQRMIERNYRSLQQHTRLQECMHHGGPCIPSVKKILVTTDEKIFPCEKVAESTSCTQIGTLDEGFDLESMENLLNIGCLTSEECKNCWALPHCSICAAQLEYREGQQAFHKADKLAACEKSKNIVISNLYELCVIHELGYRLGEEEIIL